MTESVVETGKTILVVDDTDIVLNVVVAILEAAHFHVLRAGSGAEAVKLAADYKPFVPKKLVEMVNEVLHSSNKSQDNHQFDTRKDRGAGE